MYRKMIAALGISVLALGAAACTEQETDPATPPPADPGATAPVDPTPGAPAEEATPEATAEATPGDDASPAPEARNDAALAAIETATGAVEGEGTAYEIDDDGMDDNWEVSVLVGDRSHDVTVSADGQGVVEQSDEAAEDEDVQRLEGATIELSDAIERALEEVPGTLDDAELTEEDGVVAWEVSIDTQENDDVEVYIDVTNGEVHKVDR